MNRCDAKADQPGSEAGARNSSTRATLAQEPSGELLPTQPPGQRSRKARRYGHQIRSLHAQGYSLETIRETLAEAGVVVSKSTVQREAARRPSSAAQQPKQGQEPVATVSVEEPSAQAVTTAAHAVAQPHLAGDVAHTSLRQSGKEVAEAFFKSRVTNPLLRKDVR